MSEATITRADLAEAVYQEVGLSRNESAQLLETVLDEISSALIKDEVVKISSFGSFPFARRDSALVAIPRQVKKCQSCRAKCLCSGRRRC